MGITRNRVPFNVWKWSEELKVLNLEDFSFSEYLQIFAIVHLIFCFFINHNVILLKVSQHLELDFFFHC